MQDVTEQRLTERELHAHYAVARPCASGSPSSSASSICCAASRPRWTTRWARCGCGTRAPTRSAAARSGRAPDVDPGDFEQVIRGDPLRRREGKPGLAWQTREPVVTPDVARIRGFALREPALARGLASAIAFPAVGPDGPVAVLSFCAFERRAPSPELVRTLTAIGGELGRFLSRRRAELSPAPLSEREIEVLRLAAEGLSGPGIAEQLVLSPATVKTHFEHIYEKLGVGDRAAAVAHALRTGMIA